MKTERDPKLLENVVLVTEMRLAGEQTGIP